MQLKRKPKRPLRQVLCEHCGGFVGEMPIYAPHHPPPAFQRSAGRPSGSAARHEVGSSVCHT